MNELILIEIISITSLTFTALATILHFTSLNNYFLLFLWTIAISNIYGVKAQKNYSKFIIFLIILPIVLFKNPTAYYFIISLFIILYFYLTRSLGRGNYGSYIDDLKNSLFIFIGLVILSYLGDILDRFVINGVPFIIIYFISTIILIRSLRHLNLGMDKSIIRKSNRRYLVSIIGISALVTLDKLRNTIFGTVSTIVGTIYKTVVDVIFGILYYPISAAILGLMKFVNWILSLLNKSGGEFDPIEIVTGEEIEGVATITRELPIIDISLKIIVGILAIYILYRIIKKQGERQKVLMDFVEEREFVSKEETVKHKSIKLRKPKLLSEQIRYYYKLYLIKLRKDNVEIESSSTSFEINELAKFEYPLNIIDEFREIYIENRYGFNEAEIENVEKFEKLYKNIEKTRN